MALYTLTVAVATVSVDVDINGRVDTNGRYNASTERLHKGVHALRGFFGPL